MATQIVRPSATEYAPFYEGYVSLVPDADILEALGRQAAELRAFAARIPADKELYAYGPGKWTVRQVFGHIIDAERVFAYRAFCISRGEKAPLPSFEENEYVLRAPSNSIPLGEHVSEFALLREANLLFLRRLTDETSRQLGTASGKPVSVRAIAYIMVGHARHHLRILKDRYGIA